MAWFAKNGGGYSGHKDSESTKLKKSESEKGEKHWNWQGGITPLNTIRRHSLENKEWRCKVFERDDYTCRVCLKRGGRIEVNHIKPWRSHKELQHDVDNGITLCKECHKLIFYKEEKVADFLKLLIGETFPKNRVNSGNTLEEMKKLLRQS